MDLVADGFAHPALDPVSNDGFAESPRGGKAEPRRLRTVAGSQAKCHKVAARKARPLVVSLPELGATKDPAGFRE